MPNHTRLKPANVQWKQKSLGSPPLKAIPVPLLHLFHQLVGGELPSHHHDEVLDDVLSAVHVQQTPDHHRKTAGVHLGIERYSAARTPHKLSFTSWGRLLKGTY